MTAGDDVLDALIAGVNIVELDPLDDSVGYGGLPNADGVVQLDSCCMHGPRKRAGGVGALEGVKTPSLVAKAVMEKTDHHLLVGKDAQTFARNLGFEILPDLNTPELARASGSSGSSAPIRCTTSRSGDAREAAIRAGDARHGRRRADRREPHLRHDQLQRRQREGRGLRRDDDERAGVEDSRAGSATRRSWAPGSTWTATSAPRDRPGRGEANLYNLCSYLIVEEMRRGASPKDAGMTALKRIKANTIEKRLLNARGVPNFASTSTSSTSAASMPASRCTTPPATGSFAVCDEKGPRLERLEPLLEGAATS